MDKIRCLLQKSIDYSKRTFSTYEEKPNIRASDTVYSCNPVLKNTNKSKSETDLDKMTIQEETWGWFIDPKDVMNVSYNKRPTFK